MLKSVEIKLFGFCLSFTSVLHSNEKYLLVVKDPYLEGHIDVTRRIKKGEYCSPCPPESPRSKGTVGYPSKCSVTLVHGGHGDPAQWLQPVYKEGQHRANHTSK